jgi:glycosyltransferase involved in cell wall biosynthesis
VSTAVGAIPDVITDGATGRLTPSEDTSAIARAMREVLSAPQQARTWGEQAREQARSRYSALAMTRKYEQLYRDSTRTRAKDND